MASAHGGVTMRAKSLLLCCSLVSLPSWSQSSPQEVTAQQISEYQVGMAKGCKDRGRERGDPAQHVDAFCDCMINALRGSLRTEEWQRATFFGMIRNEQEQQQVLTPHLPKVKACVK